jgi:hypothetical protein
MVDVKDKYVEKRPFLIDKKLVLSLTWLHMKS